MSDPYAFWRGQLAGNTPETTPGTAHAGFYLNPWRETYPNPNPTVGGPRRKVRIIPGVSAIWFENGEWVCVTHRPEGTIALYGQDVVDGVFARICRNAISHQQYTEEVARHEQHRNAGTEARPAVDPERDGEPLHDGPAPVRANTSGDGVPGERDA